MQFARKPDLTSLVVDGSDCSERVSCDILWRKKENKKTSRDGRGVMRLKEGRRGEKREKGEKGEKGGKGGKEDVLT